MSSTTNVRVRLFARLRELCGNNDELSLELGPGADPEACFRAVAEEYPAVLELRGRLVVAVNEEYASWTQALQDGDEVAFIPPLSGG